MKGYYGSRKERKDFKREWGIDVKKIPILPVSDKVYNDYKNYKREDIVVKKNAIGNEVFEKLITNALMHNNCRTIMTDSMNYVEHEINEFIFIMNEKTKDVVANQVTAIDEYKGKIKLLFDYSVI